jgi:hypothetical protein
MQKGVIRVAVILAILVPIGFAIFHEMSARTAIQHSLINSLDANDTAALQAWPGSAESFVAMLHDRCMRAHGGDAAACTRYQVATK